MLRTSHRRKHRVTEIVRLLAVVLFVAAIVDFGYNAYLGARQEIYYPGERITDHPKSAPRRDSELAYDAGVAVLALTAVSITSLLSKVSRRNKRLVLGVAAVVVTLLVVCSFLTVLSLWTHLV